MQALLDRQGHATGMYNDIGYLGVYIGGTEGWTHEATIQVDVQQASEYSSKGGGFQAVEVAHAYLLSHFVAPGKQQPFE